MSLLSRKNYTLLLENKMKLLKLIIIVIGITFAIDNLSAQNSKVLDWIMKEKVKVKPEEIIDKINGKGYFKKNIRPKLGDYPLSANETAVAKDDEVESEVHAVINPLDSNNIILSPIYQNVQSNEGPLSCPIYYTTNFGKSWNKSSFKTGGDLSNYQIMGGGDPMLVFDANGVAYMSWIYLYGKMNSSNMFDSVFAKTFWVYSDDKGATWKKAGDYTIIGISAKATQMSLFSPIFDLKGMYDKQWFASDLSNSQYRGNVYCAMIKIGIENNQQTTDNFVFVKSKNSNQFVAVKTNSYKYDFSQFNTVDVDKLGNVHVLFFASKDGQAALYHTVSKDGGATFSPEKKITNLICLGSAMLGTESSGTIPGINEQRFYPAPQIACDKSSSSTKNNIYVVFNANGINQNLNNGHDIYLVASHDGGETWDTPIIVNNDTKDVITSQFLPALTVNENGVVVVSWYDRRSDQNNIQTHYYVACSFNEGKTFVDQRAASSKETNFNFAGIENNEFGVGEYNMVLASKNYAIPVWADGRQNNGNLDIYVAFLPINSTTSVDRISGVNTGLSIDNISPNPANDFINCTYNIDNPTPIEYSIIDYSGKTLISNIISENNQGLNSISIKVNELNSGMYYLKMKNDNAYALMKFIIER